MFVSFFRCIMHERLNWTGISPLKQISLPWSFQNIFVCFYFSVSFNRQASKFMLLFIYFAFSKGTSIIIFVFWIWIFFYEIWTYYIGFQSHREPIKVPSTFAWKCHQFTQWLSRTRLQVYVCIEHNFFWLKQIWNSYLKYSSQNAARSNYGFSELVLEMKQMNHQKKKKTNG